MGATIATLLFSFIKESIFANYYGASYVTDAYTIAIQIPVTLFSVFSTAVSNVVLPYYSKKINSEGKESASAYISNVMTILTLISIVVVLIMEVFAEAVITIFAPGLTVQAKEMATLLFRLVLPKIVLSQLININSAVLDVHKKFLLPMLSSIILNSVFISFLCLLSNHWGIYAAVAGVLIGTALELIYSLVLRRRYVKYKWRCQFRDKDTIESVKKTAPVCVGIGVEEINKTIDSVISSFLTSGSVTMMSYASKLTSAISSLLIGAIAKVAYPEFAESAAKKDEKGMADNFLYILKVVLLIFPSVVAGGIVLSKEIVSIVYFRGEFTLDTVLSTAPIFVAYLSCLIFRAFRQNASRVFYSYGDTKTPMKNTFVGLIINTALDLALFKIFGAAGIAWATTASYMAISFLLALQLRKKNHYICFRNVLPMFVRVLIANLGMIGTIFVIKYLFVQFGWYDLTNLISMIGIVLSSVVLGIIVYFGILLILKTEEVVKICRFFLKKNNTT